MVDDNKLKKYNDIRKNVSLLSAERAQLFYETMYIVDLVLQKFEIDYSLTGGSLLGSLRHRGMIPWDDDLDVMVFNPGHEKMFEKEVVREFNKYGFNMYIECCGWRNPECGIGFVNHVYKETYLGSSDLLTDEVFDIKSVRWQDTSNPTKYNAGRRFHDAAVMDFFPHKEIRKDTWKPKWTPYTKGDRDVLSTDEIWPLKRVKFGSFEVSIINQPEAYVKKWAGENFMTQPRWTRSHGLTTSPAHKKYIATHPEIFTNLELPCLFDPSQVKSQ